MADPEKVQEHLALSKKYWKAAELLAKKGLWEPCMFNVLHAIELAVKAALYTIVEDDIFTHQVAGLFGKHYRARLGKGICREIAKTLSKYNIPRYPDSDDVNKEDVVPVLRLARKLIEDIVPKIIENGKGDVPNK